MAKNTNKNLIDLLNKIGKETVDLIVKEIQSQQLVKTGNLKKSIKYSINKKYLDLTFEMAYYGGYLDDGTKYIQPPREFFSKIIEKQLDKYSGDIAEATAQDIFDTIGTP